MRAASESWAQGFETNTARSGNRTPQNFAKLGTLDAVNHSRETVQSNLRRTPVMMLKTTTSLALAAACLAAIATMPVHAQTSPTQGNLPSSSAGTSGPAVMTTGAQTNHSAVPSSRSARQNVIQSQHYDRTLETNRGFSHARMRKECGPISDPQLHQSCLASFNQDEPSKGPSSKGPSSSHPKHRS